MNLKKGMPFSHYLDLHKGHPDAQRYRFDYDPRDGAHDNWNFIYATSPSQAHEIANHLCREFDLKLTSIKPDPNFMNDALDNQAADREKPQP